MTSDLNAGDLYLAAFFTAGAFLLTPWMLAGLVAMFLFVLVSELGA